MTTKIIITPASHGTAKVSAAGGTPRTVRVVTVGGPLSAGRPQNKTLMTLPLPASAARALPANKGEVRTVFKRVYSGTESPSRLAVMSPAPRKRQRLDHLTMDQKNQRRKLKNRVAAQTARDRKKLQMDLLESRVASLERQNDELLQQNTFLQKQNDLLSQQNALLLQRLEPPAAAAAAATTATPSTASVESAEGTGGGAGAAAGDGGGAAGAQPAQLGGLPGGAGDGRSEHADLLDLLTETIFGSEESAAAGEEVACAAVVGTAAEELESSHDTLMAPAGEEADDPTEALLQQLLEPPCSPEGTVPVSPRLSPEPPSPAHTPDLDLDLELKPRSDPVKVEAVTETDLDQWSMFKEEPLDAHFDDQFLLFPQLVL